jgi:3-hydroxyisobutyrate dehydrogenase-like beta-hydroxyacid dehydrogenase
VRVGFVGLGKMGSAIAARLVAAGHEVQAWNRTPGKAPKGARECASIREAASNAAVVCTMLADDKAVETVADDLLVGLAPKAIHCSMSTISVALCGRLRDAHAAKGQRFVAAPVFGRPDAAEAGKLWIVPAGAPDALKECEPVFLAAGQGTMPVGDDPQHASLTKLCGNFFLAMMIEGFGEAFALAEKAGLDRKRMAESLAKIIFGGAPIPTGYAGRIAANQFEPAGFAMALGLKDVSLMLQAGEALRVPMPLAHLAQENLLASLAKGRDGWDWGGFSQILRDQAGLE